MAKRNITQKKNVITNDLVNSRHRVILFTSIIIVTIFIAIIIIGILRYKFYESKSITPTEDQIVLAKDLYIIKPKKE